MPNPISHAEKIKALGFAAQLTNAEGFERCAEILRAVLAHLERTQWRDIEEMGPEHRHGNWMRVGVHEGALFVPDYPTGPATHFLVFPPAPETPR